jgi:excisionase family DNA binding protein
MPAKHTAQLAIPIGPPCLLSTREAAKRIGVSTRTLHRMKERRQISFIKLDGVLRFEPKDVEHFIQRRTVRAA